MLEVDEPLVGTWALRVREPGLSFHPLFKPVSVKHSVLAVRWERRGRVFLVVEAGFAQAVCRSPACQTIPDLPPNQPFRNGSGRCDYSFRLLPNFLVAGAGFEPATFGL